MLSSLIFLMMAQQAPSGTSEDTRRVLERAQPTLDRFYAEVRSCGARPPFKPTVRVSNSAGIIHYDPPTGSVVLYPWSVADQGTKDDAGKRAERDERPDAARSAYEDIFNEVLVAHELGHWLQSFQPEPRTPEGEYDGWFAEQDADRIAVAFGANTPASGVLVRNEWMHG
jgi:hypothetical protein